MSAGAFTIICSLVLIAVSTSQGQKTIPAQPGDSIILPCRAPDKRSVLVVEWRRTDLESDYVLLYRDDQIDPYHQHPSYLNRVDLQDRQMKDGDVSLVLKNVTNNDAGTYVCRVLQAEAARSKRSVLGTEPINSVILRVTGDNGGDRRGHLGLIALPVLVVIIAAAVFHWKKNNYPPDSAHQVSMIL